MKFTTVLAFLACLCLLAVNTKATGELTNNKEDIQQQERIIGEEIDCVFDPVQKLKVVCDKFLNDYEFGSKVHKSVQDLLNSVAKVNEKCVDFLGTYDKDCKNGKDHGLICISKISLIGSQLNKEINSSLGFIVVIEPEDTSKCILGAISKLNTLFSELLGQITGCH